MHVLRCLRLVVLPCFFGGCVAAPDGSPAVFPDESGETPDPAAEAARLLAGRFDSSSQAGRDGQYFPVQLMACHVDAPQLGEHVLYVEQAMMTALDAPYRQRVYVVTETDDVVVSAVNELDAPEQVIGICDFSDTDRARVISQRVITPLPGCEVVLRETDTGFSGGTVGQGCLNDHSGAVYATSEVTLNEGQIVTWDRGYDDEDVQVWGATAGAYVFDRIE